MNIIASMFSTGGISVRPLEVFDVAILSSDHGILFVFNRHNFYTAYFEAFASYKRVVSGS